MEGATSVLCLIGVVGLVFVVFLSTALRIVPEYQRLVVFRLALYRQPWAGLDHPDSLH